MKKHKVLLSYFFAFFSLAALVVVTVKTVNFQDLGVQALQRNLALIAQQPGSVICSGGLLTIVSAPSATQLTVKCNEVSQSTPTPSPSATPIQNTPTPQPSITPQPTASATPSPQPSATPNNSPQPPGPSPSLPPGGSPPPVGQVPGTHVPVPPPSGNFPCGTYVDPAPGCTPISYQAWFDDVPVNPTNSIAEYTPLLNHIHYEMAVPLHRKNGTNPKQSMELPVRFVRYNNTFNYNSSNSGWYRSQDQGSTYEQFDLNLPQCQSSKYQSVQCMSWHMHHISSSDFSSATEMRFTPNVKVNGERHFLSSNWQTGIGYRSSSEVTARYWQARCGGYQRVILKDIDKFFTGSEPIPIVSGTISQSFTTNGGCGTVHKTYVFINPSQHTGPFASNKGITAMEVNSQFSGDFVWNTKELNSDGEPKYPNGLYNVLFINFEGTDKYIAASGINVLFIVQN